MTPDEAELHVVEDVITARRRFRWLLTICVLLIMGTFLVLAKVYYGHAQSLHKDIENATNRALIEIKRTNEATIQENKTQNEETRRYITCLLLVPIQDRSPELQQECIQKSNLPGGIEPGDFQTKTPVSESEFVTPLAVVPNPPLADSESFSSVQPIPPEPEMQQEISQPQPSPAPTAPASPSIPPNLPNPIASLLQQALNPLLEIIEGLL